ncbi:MAG: amidohydrolase family protein [Eubacteriaceae bacterium]
MLYDIIIKNGTVIDPSRKIHKVEDIYIYKDSIMLPPKNNDVKARQVIDAHGYYVMPGLIENHTHIFYGGGDLSIPADVIMLPSGVTSAIDHGSSGIANFDIFYRSVVKNSLINIKAYLNVNNIGIATERYFEDIDPKYFDKDQIKYYYRKYSDTILGLKIRLCKESCKNMGLYPLEKTIEIAEEVGCPISVHVKNPSVPIPEIAKLLRKGDVWVHMYQVSGDTILNKDNNIYRELYNAKERGVIFDVASGRRGFTFDLIKRALNQDFKPDLLGTDLVAFNVYERPLFSLVYTMSMYLNLGFSIDEVVALCTNAPAKVMDLEKHIGTLKEDSIADVCIMKLCEKDIEFFDMHGGNLKGEQLLVPQMTIKSGKVVYRNIEF